MLELNELDDLLDEIGKKVIMANRTGELENLLRSWGLLELIRPNTEYSFKPLKTGKILVLGSSEVKENVLSAICKDVGIEKERLEFCLDYNAVQKYNIRKLQYNPNYVVVLAGPMPHSGMGKGDSSSMLTEMESQDGYPPVVRLTTGNELKITKSSFKEALNNLSAKEAV